MLVHKALAEEAEALAEEDALLALLLELVEELGVDFVDGVVRILDDDLLRLHLRE